jgi:hypothetical protein
MRRDEIVEYWPSDGPALMHLRSLSAAAGFATGLLAIYFVPTGGWPLDIVLVLAVSLLGGYMIGQWWAVGVAVGSNIVFSTLYLFAYDDLFRITPNHDSSRVAVILAGQLLVSAIATAVAVWQRRRIRPGLGSQGVRQR